MYCCVFFFNDTATTEIYTLSLHDARPISHELLQAYQDWSQQQKGKALSVALVYASAYGNTATIAQTLARGITKAGVAVESINAEQADPDDIKAAIEKSAGFLIGSPTLGGHAPTQIQTALGIILSTASKPQLRSEERRVGKECRSRWSPYH